ncbi:MAG TPA: carbohydrate ABC transporter permease, partial [bacterium]|nr:carbohydrate ABC transporter permease [bacterium]
RSWARRWLGAVPVYGVLVLSACAMLLPFAWMLATSLKAPGDVFRDPPVWLPVHPRWSNYADAVRAAPFARFFLNSVIVSTAITVGQLTTASLAAFALARRVFPGRRLILGFFVATLLIPGEITIIPAYLIVRTLGWVDTYAALIVPFLASGFAVFLLHQAFLTVPQEFEDAAAIDGATGLGFLTRILLPVCRPAVGSLGLLTFVASWNSYLWPLIVTDRNEMRPVQVALRYFMDADLGNRWPELMAASVLIVAPIVVLFLIVQRQFVQGLTAYGLKG